MVNFKMKVKYSVKVRRRDNIEIRVEHRGVKSKIFTNVLMAKDYIESNSYEKSFGKLKLLKLNYYILTKQADKANIFLDRLLDIAYEELCVDAMRKGG